MASTLPRAARTCVADVSKSLQSCALRLAGGYGHAASWSSRSFSTSHRCAATKPASTYVRRPAPVAKAAVKPAPVKPAPVNSSTVASTASSTTASPAIDSESPIKDMTKGLADGPLILDEGTRQVDWTRSFHGLSSEPFSKEAADVLLAPIAADDVEVKPDGIVYLPEIKYRRILNKAFGPGGWGLAPRGETIVTGKSVTREYALVAHGRLVSVARGEQDYFSPEGIPTATEGCKSNALMRCCKDLGIASELWDPRFIRTFIKTHAKQVWGEHVLTKKKKQLWVRKDDEIRYPYKESKFGA